MGGLRVSSELIPTNTVGGGIDQTAVIAHAPEHRNWKEGDPSFAPEIDPTARVEAYCTVDAGMVRPTKIRERSWLLKHTHVGHDVQIGRDCELSSGAIIGGHCIIGDGVKIGLGAVILPMLTIENGARIGAGAVVTKNVPAYECWVGNPAKFLRYETNSDR